MDSTANTITMAPSAAGHAGPRAIEAEGLVKTYGETRALDGLELVADAGIARVAGYHVRSEAADVRRHIGLAGQDASLDVLDEPTTGVDPRSRLAMWEIIRDLAAFGTTLLLTTQYLEEADELADRIAVADRGRVIAEGTARELQHATLTRSTEQERTQPFKWADRSMGSDCGAEAHRRRLPDRDVG